MSVIAQSFGIGIMLGIILFFVCAYFGWIDKLLISVDRWFR
jgi:predicted RND superfamily exporter protein